MIYSCDGKAEFTDFSQWLQTDFISSYYQCWKQLRCIKSWYKRNLMDLSWSLKEQHLF